MDAAPLDAHRGMAPVAIGQRTGTGVRTGREDAGTAGERCLPHRHQPAVIARRSRLDDDDAIGPADQRRHQILGGRKIQLGQRIGDDRQVEPPVRQTGRPANVAGPDIGGRDSRRPGAGKIDGESPEVGAAFHHGHRGERRPQARRRPTRRARSGAEVEQALRREIRPRRIETIEGGRHRRKGGRHAARRVGGNAGRVGHRLPRRPVGAIAGRQPGSGCSEVGRLRALGHGGGQRRGQAAVAHGVRRRNSR